MPQYVMTKYPDILYYNCKHPIEILDQLEIQTSKVFTGVSLCEWSELGSHGPFKISFKKSDWFKQCIRVRYWSIRPKPLRRVGQKELPLPKYFAVDQYGLKVTEVEYSQLQDIYNQLLVNCGGKPNDLGRIWKTTTTFANEREWYSPMSIKFAADDVVGVTFMNNSPNLISTRKINKIKAVLADKLGTNYSERKVSDPYLSKY